MIIQWLDHASFLLKASGINVYIDPYLGEYVEKADIILVTHSHFDHCDLGKIEIIRKPETIIITSEDCARKLSGNVVSMSPGDRKDVQDFSITAVESYNIKRFRSPGVLYHPINTQVGFIVEAEGKRVYHAGDTDFLPFMKNMGNIDVALLPIMGRATMDVDEAVEATIGIQPETVMPMHHRDSDPMEFKDKVEKRTDIKVIVMKEGEELTL